MKKGILFALFSVHLSVYSQQAVLTPIIQSSDQVSTHPVVDETQATQQASESQTGLISLSSLPVPTEPNQPILESILAEQDISKRYLQLSSFVKGGGEWISLMGSQGNVRIHVISYLLQNDREAEAVLLLKNRDVKGWLSYEFMGNVANDFLFAVQEGMVDYITTLCLVYSEGINSPITISLRGDQVLPLSVLADKTYKSKPYYEAMVRTLLKYGANPAQPMPNGLTSLTVASSSGNVDFVRIVQAFNAENSGAGVGLLENTPLNTLEIAEMQDITDAFLEKSMEDNKKNYNLEKLHEFWLQMIIKGYNKPANLIYDTLLTYKEFSVDKKSKSGINALMAASMSDIYGGNVEYAKTLIDRGADPHHIFEVEASNPSERPIRSNLIQLALQKDNFKIVALLITKQVNFLLSPDVDGKADAENPDSLIISEAMHLQAYRSAYVLREALMQHLSNMERAESGQK